MNAYFTLIEIHNTDDDHEVGGQDVPYKVTMRYCCSYSLAEEKISNAPGLYAFNIQPGKRNPAPDHIEFLTFAYDEIYKFVGTARPLTEKEEYANRYWRSLYAKNIGELRAAISDLPDSFPLIHTGRRSDSTEAVNRLGVHVAVNQWVWHTPQQQQYYGDSSYAMRIDALDNEMWKRIVDGTFENSTKLYR